MARVLHLEDEVNDHKLVRATLASDGVDASMERVDSEESFRATLGDTCYDLILADYNLRGFDGMAALGIARELCPDVPFIVVSGAMGDIAVADILRAGATDFVLKDHLDRLAPAIRRALREAAERQARRDAEAAMREARDAAENANRAKDRFLAMLSHELRTPLSPVVLALNAMHADPDLPPKFAADLAMVRRNIDLEVALIDDLLDLSRVASGKLRLRESPAAVHALIDHVIASTASEAAEKRLTLAVDLASSADVVLGDASRLQQVLWNLVRNAVKFTPPGGRIDVRTRDTADGRIRIEVVDTGRGIDAAALPRLFEPFEQTSPDVTRQFGGLGLGLSIVKAIVEAHGGYARASSEGAGRGATFVIDLPVVASPAASIPDGRPTPVAAAHGEDAVRVLLVEDHDDTRRLLARMLGLSNCVITAVAGVAEATRAAAGGSFDVVVSDIGLPDGTGYDLMTHLRDAYGLPGIALTGYGMEDDIERGRRAGFVDHLLKPVDFDQLRKTVRRVAGKASGRV